MSNESPKVIRIADIAAEEGAAELTSSPEMRPYIELAKAVLSDSPDVEKYVKAVAELPLEKRYVWRVASALKWAFADYDSSNVVVDHGTLESQELRRVAELLRLRPIQFCLFLKSLVGAEEMERMMVQAIAAAKEDS